MAIKYAILAILNAKPQTGYDLKKAFVGSPVFYWAGSNNQIYNTLSDLLKAGLVTKRVQPQEKRPAKSIYTVTDKGLAELREWTISPPDVPECRNSLWMRLTAVSMLSAGELKQLVDQYEHDVHTRLLMQREMARRGHIIPTSTPREDRVQDLIEEGIAGFYERELEWINRLRQKLEIE